MKKQLQKLGMAIAIPFTMTTSVAVGQCPTINSLNLSTGPNGQVNVTANMSSTITPGTFEVEVKRIGSSNLPSSYGIFNSNMFSFNYLSNGDIELSIKYEDLSNSCATTMTGSLSILNVINNNSSCPNIITSLQTSNFELQVLYTGLVSPTHDIFLTIPSGVTHTVLSKGYFKSSSYLTDYTLTLSDPTNTNCSANTSIVHPYLTDSCGADASFIFSLDSSNTGIYYINNYSTAGTGPWYSWDFGDGSTSTLAYPTHSYTTTGNYTICLTVTDVNMCSDYQCISTNQMAKIVVKNPNAITGIDEQELVSSLVAYPNPITDELTIEINANNSTTLSYSITDALGKVVNKNKLTNSKTVINTSSLNNGFYVLSILNEKGNVLKTSKLVK